MAAPRKRIAMVLTVYTRNSHADVLAGRILEGYEYYGKRSAPRLATAAMYVDQAPKGDMSRDMAAKNNVRVCPSVREALTLGGGKLAVDGVVLIGEHGEYPNNEKGQKLYPRYELFRQIVEVFRASGRAVPVFTDKHLSVEWEKAKWMYDQSRALKFPLMAGSSLPLAWRKPPLEIELDSPAAHAVSVFYGGTESYGFHALEALECMVERRKGGETGIAAVECLEGQAVWEWTGKNAWAEELLAAALERSETRKAGSPKDNTKRPVVFVLEYRDGLRAATYLLNEHVRDCTVAVEVRGMAKPPATEIWLQGGRPHSHFCGLAHYVEELILTGQEQYPVERTLLTTGTLAALMDSAYRGHARLETPWLDVKYKAPRGSFYNRGPVPALETP
jgi:hypothetical protein